MTALRDQQGADGMIPKRIESEFVQRANELANEMWCIGMKPDARPSGSRAVPERQPMLTGPVAAEIARIEAVMLGALNALYRLRRIGEPGDRAVNAARLPIAQAPDEIPEWMHVAQAAGRLKAHPTTVWTWAGELDARWPYGKARQVDFAKLKHLRPGSERC